MHFALKQKKKKEKKVLCKEKFLQKIQTAAGLPLELKKSAAQNGMPLVGNNLLAADQASVNSTNVCTYSKMGSKTEQ